MLMTTGAPNNAVVTSIELTYRSGHTGGNVTVSAGSFSKSGTKGTWTGSAQDVTLNMGRNGDDFAQITAINVTTKSF